MVFQPFADTDRTTKPPFAASPDPDDSPMTDPGASAFCWHPPFKRKPPFAVSSPFPGVQPLV